MRILMLGVVMATFASAASAQGSSPTASAAAISKDWKPGQVFRDCPECPEMVVIPAGGFLMGSPPDEPGRFTGEDPQRQVNIRQFAVGKFDVKRGEWAEFAKLTNRAAHEGCEYSGFPKDQANSASWRNLGFPQDEAHPVVCVTWGDVQDYVHWLSQRTGHKSGLPVSRTQSGERPTLIYDGPCGQCAYQAC